MADELLSINTETLDAIAGAIKSKAGLPSSNKLSFPGGMVSALQAIETEATVTPKITPQQKVLTPSETQFVIEQGFHNGTGTVSIQLDTTNNSANPTTTQQTYYPASGKFFGSFLVGGIGAGTQVATGTRTYASDSDSFQITGLPFTPTGIAGFVKRSTTTKEYKDLYVAFYKANGANSQRYTLSQSSVGSGSPGGSSPNIVFAQGSVTIEQYSSSMYNGDYFYVVWGS